MGEKSHAWMKRLGCSSCSGNTVLPTPQPASRRVGRVVLGDMLFLIYTENIIFITTLNELMELSF